MTFVGQLQTIAQDLRAARMAPRVTVRDFLAWFDAQRRGYAIVERIRGELQRAGLSTEPDFESAFIDSEIEFKLLSNTGIANIVEGGDSSAGIGVTELVATSTAVASATADLTTSAAVVISAREADPAYRISKLKGATNKPVFVAPTAELVEAVTVMLSNDFSQLPVMSGERDVKGVISWQSLGTRLALGKPGTLVKDLMDAPQEIRADLSIFQAIPIIADHQYVLVRGSDNRITGILTSSDLNIQFQQLAEPFLQLGEIENQIRHILGQKFSADELSQACDPGDAGRQVRSISDLSFGEYIRLVENPARWARVGLPIDRKTFCSKLEIVRLIRNDVMHFDPDGIPPSDLEHLRELARFLQRLKVVGIT
jgi:CBS domain-containing protein